MEDFKNEVARLTQIRLDALNRIAMGRMSLSDGQLRLQYLQDNIKEFSAELTALANRSFVHDENTEEQNSEVYQVIKDAVTKFTHAGIPKFG
jgi:hypothetical protein